MQETFQPKTLTELREMRGLSQATLARLARANAATIYKWEHRRTRPSPGNLERLSEILNWPLSELRLFFQ